ncbi:hypothetical protein HPB48_011645 [Haemaphysalis longicornis]|uniref:Uncharacterized protein n=1 Tax=Haemaphysalis longicornis TaxID=44386 RepID=A0A9J6G3Y4_HAELO|nr:hypothetical protein HPB48_011645 [Haemaphysalis longicornis]
MLLNSLNSCVNPWIYLFFNRNLVEALRARLCACCSDRGDPVSSFATAPSSRGASGTPKASAKHAPLSALQHHQRQPQEAARCGSPGSCLNKSVKNLHPPILDVGDAERLESGKERHRRTCSLDSCKVTCER